MRRMASNEQRDPRLWAALSRLVEDIDIESVEKEVAELRIKHPDADETRLSELLTRRSATKAAGTGAVAGAAGGLLALVALAPDVWNLVRQQSRLVLGISIIWGDRPSPEDRAKEVLATLASATGTALARRTVARVSEKAVAEAIARGVLGKLLSRRAAALAPLVGSAVAGSANWMAVTAVGRAANAHYRNRRERQSEESS